MTVLTALVLLVLPAATPAQPVGKYFDSDGVKIHYFDQGDRCGAHLSPPHLAL